MPHYNLRPTTLTGAKLDAELRNYGAHTSGSTERKQARLARFMSAETRYEEAREALRVVVENEQRKVYDRCQTRAQAILSRGY